MNEQLRDFQIYRTCCGKFENRLIKALKDFSLPLEMTVWTAFKTIFMELPAVVTTI